MSGYNQSIYISNRRDFDIAQILECGQIFRYFAVGEGEYEVYSADKRCRVTQNAEEAVIACNDEAYFRRYFDLETDYGVIKARLHELPYMAEAVEYGGGIRILRQDKWEMLISFIISANNHIPRIKGIIDRLCRALGEDKGGYFAFPTPDAMAEKDADFYAALGAGYRAPFLAETARDVADGRFDLDALPRDGAQANKALCKLKGVGPKVADCVLLFGYGYGDVFPVDTWIKKLYADIDTDASKENERANGARIRRKLIALYGDLSGYAQQYLFFNKRDKAINR